MKKKYFLYIVIAGILLFFSIPAFHLLKTYWNEDEIRTVVPKGYTNDASGLNLTKVDSIIDVPHSKEAIEEQLKELLAFSKMKQIPLSIAGAKHSMGGHTMYPDGIVVNMRPYNHMKLDGDVLTVGSGALWEEVINYLDKYKKSVAIMQAFSSFSVGGSMSVNGHGWQKNAPPMSSSVLSFTLMKADGEIVTCSRTENKELFSLVIGGYGLFGIILDVKLKVVDNENLNFNRFKFESTKYLSYFRRYARDDEKAKLVFGRLNISEKDFLEYATLNVFTSSKTPLSDAQKPEHSQKSNEIKRIIFRSTVNSEYGKRLRWDLETELSKFSSDENFSRNEVLNDNVALIENKDSTSTDILQEYFIPERNFNEYIQALKKDLRNTQIDLLNITIRDVYQDHDSYMNYARENVFGFVFLFNQKKNPEDEEAMKKLTQKLVQTAIRMEGTYYLPYRLHVEKEAMRKAYPQSDAFFQLKLKYDPDQIFKNKFYDYYK
ncbi:FAD-binding oxidoreductase [Flavobacterium humi]|uniref:FAD-binding oxidoreductase n=1 Tax=Flavobacterium humi TaxID=2562683 RepID=A0A4Z0L845_9FLAO|nr:FAD-binding oxidoreductase [Flavobacterium humi]